MAKTNRAGFLPLKTKKRLNTPPANQPWGWFSFELLESGAMRSLSINARRVLDRIRIEHMSHAGLENGRLKVTWNDFVKFGISRRFITAAQTEVIAVGIVAIERPGRRAHGEDKGAPTEYRLTYLPVAEPGDFRPPTNEWKQFGTNVKAATNAIKAHIRRQSGNGKAEEDDKFGLCRRKIFSPSIQR
jgi:hypothetical protein